MFNVLLILYLVIMCLIWAHYGLFSATIHLLITIVAGCLALALWEPLALGLLIGLVPKFAWCVGLLIPFVFWMVLLRTVSDKLIKANMDLSLIVNSIGGGFVGLLSGILTSGLTIIGLGFLPLGTRIAGFMPLEVDGGGQVHRHANMLISVDRMASGFFTRISNGSMYSGFPISQYLPDLDEQAEVHRLHYDPHASIVAVPDAIELGEYIMYPMPIPSLDPSIAEFLKVDEAANKQLVIVETVISTAHDAYLPPYDNDRRLRIAPTQTQLLTENSNRRRRISAEIDRHAPVAMVYVDSRGRRMFIPVDKRDTAVESSATSQSIAWVFMIEEYQKPTYLLFRRLRIRVPSKNQGDIKERQVRASLGEPADSLAPTDPAGTADASGSGVNQGHGTKGGSQPVLVEATDALPHTISMHKTNLIKYQDGRLLSGREPVRPPRSRVRDKSLLVKRIFVTAGQASIRVTVEQQELYSILGRALGTAADLSAPNINDNIGGRHWPIGYIWTKPDRLMDINFPEYEPIKSAKQLPIREMNPEDKLYLYFSVPNDVSIISYQLANREWKLDQPIQP